MILRFTLSNKKSQQIKITMSNRTSINPIDQDLLRLLSFSPDEAFEHKLKNNRDKSSYLKSDLLFQVYHNSDTKRNLRRDKELRKQSRDGVKGSVNPQRSEVQNSKLKLIEKSKVTLQQSKIRAKSSHQIKPKKYYMSINFPHTPHQHHTTTRTISNQQIPSTPTQNTSTLSLYKTYTSSKQAFRNLSRQRIQEQKDLTFLSRTFYNVKKSEEQAKRDLINSFKKRMEREEKERQKLETKRKHEEWLEQQKNENSTRKYMNHLLKYHAKKNLVEKNTECVQQMRSRLKSQESVKSQRSLVLSQEKKHRTFIMKAEKQENIQNAKLRTVSRIKQKSNSVRHEMAKVYACEGELEAWRIEKIDERSKFMLATIQKSKKNREVLQKVLKEAKNMDSSGLYETLKNSLAQAKTQRKATQK